MKGCTLKLCRQPVKPVWNKLYGTQFIENTNYFEVTFSKITRIVLCVANINNLRHVWWFVVIPLLVETITFSGYIYLLDIKPADVWTTCVVQQSIFISLATQGRHGDSLCLNEMTILHHAASWLCSMAPIHQADGRLTARSHEVSNPRDSA